MASWLGSPLRSCTAPRTLCPTTCQLLRIVIINCRGGHLWPPVVSNNALILKTGGHRGPPLQLHSKSHYYQTSSAAPAPVSGMTGSGTFRPEESIVLLIGEEADLSTAVDTQRMYLVRASGLLAWSGLSSGLLMNLFNAS